MQTETTFAAHYLKNVRALFLQYKSLGEKAIAQLKQEDINRAVNKDSNSIAIIVKHLSGNMLSRWTDFLTSDGEKSWRNRDSEFEGEITTMDELMAAWNKGWDCLFNAINNLQEDDLQKIIYIRNEGHTVMEAINRQIAHYSYHVGQIVYLAKELKNGGWESLSIPKKKSEQFNEEKFSKEKERRNFA